MFFMLPGLTTQFPVTKSLSTVVQAQGNVISISLWFTFITLSNNRKIVKPTDMKFYQILQTPSKLMFCDFKYIYSCIAILL